MNAGAATDRDGIPRPQGSGYDIGAYEFRGIYLPLVYDPRNPRWVYAATEGYGILCSFDGGES